MTNLKKTLAVVLAFAMMLSMGSVFAYSDVEDGTTVSEAVSILSNLNILTGFEDGTFRPDETVTRAQMAAIICRMLGYEDQAQSSMGTTVFDDVAASHWASGYINVTQAQGVINGYGNGNFGPEDKVTYEQAVKMIVSALGYDLAAARKGGYPTGYLAIASAEGITKKANGRVGDAAARSTIAVLVYNALDVQLMDQYSWTTDGSDEYGKISDTVLTKYHGIYKFRGIVEETPVSYVAGNAYDPDATPMAYIGGDVEELIFSDKGLPLWSDCSDLSLAADKVDVNNFLGKAVILYAGEDQVTGKDTIFAIAEDESKNDSFKISATQLAKEDEKYWEEDGVIGYREVGASKVKDIALADGAEFYVNYEGGYTADTTKEVVEFFEAVGFGGTVEFISNDADSDYEVVILTAYMDEAVIESVEEEEGELAFELYTGDEPSNIDPEDEDVMVIVYKDGELATAADLAANDTVAYVEVADNFEIYFASSATVTGTVDSYDVENNVVTIAGEDYEVSAASGIEVNKLSGEEGIFFLNVDGQIAYNETAPTAVGNYSLILAGYESTDGMDKGFYLQVVLADGTLAEYKTSDTAKVYDADGEIEVQNTKDNKDVVYNYFTGKMSPDDDIFKATVANLKNDADLMVKLTVSNNKITKIRLLEGDSDSVAAGKEYDAEAMSLGTVDFDDNTIVFSVKQTAGFVEAEDIVIGSVADFFVDEEPTTGDVLVYDADDKTDIFAAAVGFGLAKTIDPASDLFIVTGKKTKVIDDNDAYVLTGYVNGKKETVTVYDADGEYTDDPADVTIGDIILLAEADAEGIVADIYVLVDYDKDTDDFTAYASDADAKDEIFAGIGTVVISDTNKFAIDGPGAAIELEEAGAFVDNEENIAAGTELSYRSSATYTLVNFAENAKNPEVSTKNGTKSLFNVEKYTSVAYVRYVDGRMADVVVYRMAEID